jgi:signal transduction histidine kinase
VKITAGRKKKPQPSFGDEYVALLHQYAAGGGEAALGRAYELGRRAITERKSLLEISSLHHQALQKLVRDAEDGKRRENLLRMSADFLAESLSPYELAHQAFHDSVKALRHLNETLEEEIKRIAYAVHDEAGQLLVAVHLALADLERDLPRPHKDQIGQIEELLNQIEGQLRRYSHELRPTVLDDLGWIAAIRFLADSVAKRVNLPIEVKAPFAGRLSRSTEVALYRLVQEGLTNASKHARASRVLIKVWRQDRMLCCCIQDDGVGFDLHAVQSEGKRKGLGLIGMQERLNAIGGILSIDSARGRGTKILIRLPMENPDGDSRGTSR